MHSWSLHAKDANRYSCALTIFHSTQNGTDETNVAQQLSRVSNHRDPERQKIKYLAEFGLDCSSSCIRTTDKFGDDHVQQTFLTSRPRCCRRHPLLSRPYWEQFFF